MITERSIQTIGRVFKNASFVRSVPFRWNSKLFILENEPNSRYRKIHYTMAVRIWIRVLFLIVSYSRELKKQNVIGSQKYVHIFWILCFFFTSILIYNNLRKKNEIVSFMNKQIGFIQCLHVTYTKKNTFFPTSNLQRMAKMSTLVTGVTLILFSIRYLKSPCTPWLYYSMSCTSTQHTNPWSWWTIPFLLFEMVDILIAFSVIQFFMFTELLYTYSSSYWLQEINFKKGGPATIDTLRCEQTSFHVFRCFQILNHLYNGCYSSLVSPFAVLLVIVVSVNLNVICVRLHDQIKMPGFLIFPMLSFFVVVMILISYPIAAKIHTLSISYVNSWRPVCGKYGKKFLCSCPTLKIKSSNFFFLRKFTTFKIFSLIIYWTCRVLIMISKSQRNR